mgnify:CR=1 FL=1
MVIDFEEYLAEFNKKHQDDTGIALNSPEVADKIIKLLEWKIVLYTNKARIKGRESYYHNRVANTEATIEVVKDIKANMLKRTGDKI